MCICLKCMEQNTIRVTGDFTYQWPYPPDSSDTVYSRRAQPAAHKSVPTGP